MNQNEEIPQPPQRIPTLEGGYESPAGTRPTSHLLGLSSDSSSNGPRQNTNADAHADIIEEWASMSGGPAGQSLGSASTGLQSISRTTSAETGISSGQGDFHSTYTLPSWQDPQSMTQSFMLAGVVPAPPTALTRSHVDEPRTDAVVTVFEFPNTSVDSVGVARTDSDAYPANFETLSPLSPSAQDKRPRITFATTVKSTRVSPSQGVESESQLLPLTPQTSQALENTNFTFPLEYRSKNVGANTSAQSLGGSPSATFHQIEAGKSLSISGSANLKGGSGRWLSSSQSQANSPRRARQGQSQRHNNTRLPQARSTLPYPEEKSGTLVRRHSVQAPGDAIRATGASPTDPFLLDTLKRVQDTARFSAVPVPSSSVASSSAGTFGSLSLSAPASASSGNGRPGTSQRRASAETRTPNGGSLQSIHEAVTEEHQVVMSGVNSQILSQHMLSLPQRHPTLYMTAQRPPTAATLRSVSVDPTSPLGASPPSRVVHQAPPLATSRKEMVVDVLASAHHLGPTASHSSKDSFTSDNTIGKSAGLVNDLATYFPWCPMFIRRLCRPLYSRMWLPISDYFAASSRKAFSNPKSRLWLALDILVSLADLFYMLVIPVSLAFVCDTPRGFTKVQFSVDIVVTLLLVLDYLRPRRDKYGQLITDPVHRKRNYWSSYSNRCKVISCIPFDWIMHVLISEYLSPGFTQCSNPTKVFEFSDGTMSLSSDSSSAELVLVHERYSYFDRDIDTFAVAFTVLRLIRLLHVSDTVVWFRNMRISGVSRAITRLAKNLLAAAYISLWNAVLFWFLSSHLNSPKRYIVNYMFDPDTRIPTSFTERVTWAYVDGQKALFFILREVKLVQESAYQAVEMMLGAIVYGSIFGNLVSIVKSLDDQAEFDKTIKQRNFKKACLRQYLIENQFPQSLQQRILDQEELDFALKKGMDMDEIFNTFPRTMKQEVLVHLYWDLISKVPLFAKTSDMFKLAMLERITTVSVQSGFYIFKAGDAGTDLFFIKRGSVQILTGDESKVIVTLQAGAFFGEIALVEDCQRTATAKTASETQLCALSKPDFLEIMRAYPTMAELVHQHVREKHEADAQRKAAEERAKLDAAAKAALDNQHDRSHHSGLLSGMLQRARNGTLSRHTTLLRGGSGSKNPSLTGTLRFGTIKKQLMSRKEAVVGSIRSIASGGASGSRMGDDLKNLEASRSHLASGGELQKMFTANRRLSEDASANQPDVGLKMTSSEREPHS